MLLRRLLTLCLTFFLAACGGKKETPRDAAERFFSQCNTAKSAEAYAGASTVFRLERTQRYFEARVRDIGLDTATGAELGEVAAKGKTMFLPANVKLKSGNALALEVSLIEEAGQWRLFSARSAAGGEDVFESINRATDNAAEGAKSLTDAMTKTIPTEHQLQQLVERTLLAFNDALAKEDFSDFYASTSERWRLRGKGSRALNYSGSEAKKLDDSDPENRAQRLTVGALDRAFRGFIEAKVDLSTITAAKLIFDEAPALNTNAVLNLRGHLDGVVFQKGFPPIPNKLSFNLEFVMEGSKWMLFGITVNLLPATGK